MKCHFWGLAALAFSLAVVAFQSPTFAQSRTYAHGRPYAHGRMRLAQQTTATPAPTKAAAPEELPSNQYPGGPMPGPSHSYDSYDHGYVDEGYSGYGGGPGCQDGYCDDGCYGPNSCDSCGGYGGDCCCGNSGFYGDLLGGYCPRGQFFVTADYLYVRASFSDALSHIEREIDEEPDTIVDHFRRFDFDYESSYRFGGGYQLPSCNEEIRFLYTRLASSADNFVFSDDDNDSGNGSNDTDDLIFLPFSDTALDDQVALMHALVKVHAFDVEFAKTIPLGGNCGYGSGCGDPCGGGCPAWDVTWSGGFRFAKADWDRSYLVGDGETVDTRFRSAMNFQGGGPRVGLEGRRYWGQGGWLSVFLKGNISLLLWRCRFGYTTAPDTGSRRSHQRYHIGSDQKRPAVRAGDRNRDRPHDARHAIDDRVGRLLVQCLARPGLPRRKLDVRPGAGHALRRRQPAGLRQLLRPAGSGILDLVGQAVPDIRH